MKLVFGLAGADAVTAACFVELCRAASRALEIEIVPRYLSGGEADTYDALRSMMSRGELALAWAPPLLGAEIVHANLGVPLVVPVRHGATTFASAFVVRTPTSADPASWPTKSALEALTGKRVAWVDPKSAAGYVLPRIHLASHGFDVARFFGGEEIVGTHLAALDAVVSGRADVSATFCRVGARGEILSAGWLRADGRPIRHVHVAATTEHVPNDAIIVAKTVDPGTSARVLGWMLSPDETSAPLLLELMTTSTFQRAPLDHFEPLRAMLERARASGFA